MKKVISTLTAVAFALGLAAAGQAQTAGKDEAKPAVKTESPAPQAQVTKDVAKPGDPAKPAVTEEVKPGDKAKEAAKPGADQGKTEVKPGDKDKTKKDKKDKKNGKKSKDDKKAATPVEKPKEDKK